MQLRRPPCSRAHERVARRNCQVYLANRPYIGRCQLSRAVFALAQVLFARL